MCFGEGFVCVIVEERGEVKGIFIVGLCTPVTHFFEKKINMLDIIIFLYVINFGYYFIFSENITFKLVFMY